jgi:hypothetical protein
MWDDMDKDGMAKTPWALKEQALRCKPCLVREDEDDDDDDDDDGNYDDDDDDDLMKVYRLLWVSICLTKRYVESIVF